MTYQNLAFNIPIAEACNEVSQRCLNGIFLDINRELMRQYTWYFVMIMLYCITNFAYEPMIKKWPDIEPGLKIIDKVNSGTVFGLTIYFFIIMQGVL